MRNLFVSVLLLVLVWPVQAASTRGWTVGPRPAVSPAGVVLTAVQDKVLRARAGDFRLWRLDEFNAAVRSGYPYSARQAPSAALGDFNGDGQMDIVLYGRTQTEVRLLVLLSQAKTCRLLDVTRYPYTDDVLDAGTTNGKPDRGLLSSLRAQTPGMVEVGVDGQTLKLIHDAFNLELYGKGNLLYYLKQGRFEEVSTGC